MSGEKRKGVFLSLLLIVQIVLIVLKVKGKIEWSWWKVFTPTYITIGLFVFSYAVMALVGYKMQ